MTIKSIANWLDKQCIENKLILFLLEWFIFRHQFWMVFNEQLLLILQMFIYKTNCQWSFPNVNIFLNWNCGKNSMYPDCEMMKTENSFHLEKYYFTIFFRSQIEIINMERPLFLTFLLKTNLDFFAKFFFIMQTFLIFYNNFCKWSSNKTL